MNSDGRTRGAPVYAAADGELWWQGGSTGSLILDHGDGYYTMYSHMNNRISVPRGTFIARGSQIGTVGAVNPTPTVPHLHFTFFRGEGSYAERRHALPLSFEGGYDFPDTGRCNAHGGALLTNGGTAPASNLTMSWAGAEAQSWQASGRVDWQVSDPDGVRGFSQRWDAEPAADKPQFSGADKGYAELSEPGKHTLYVRAWDKLGNQILESREFWYDPTAPSAPPSKEQLATLGTNQDATLAWASSSDELSGVKGYQIYLGPDAEGTGDWFVESPQVKAGQLGTGRYYLRARAQDQAGNFSAWATIEVINVQ